MSRSRKLFVAASLLAGGYSVALFASGVSDFVWARRLLRDAGTTSTSGVVSPDGSSIRGQYGVETTQLVPESAAGTLNAGNVKHGAAATASGATHPATSPTWRSPVPQANWIGATGDKQNDAAVANFVDGATASADERAARGGAVMPEQRPRARLTDVKPSGTAAAGKGTDAQRWSASPWDRWPRWEPPAAATTAGVAVAPTDRAVAPATFENSAPASVPAEPASFGQPNDPRTGRASFAAGSMDSTDDFAELRTHIIVDGDSLSKLAGRYLDDPQLGEAIFQLNRDVLLDPDLLPIGTELKIPERRMASSSRAGLPPRNGGGPPPVRPTDLGSSDDAWESADTAP